jgi:beta-aspartyl-peptidase (threonine type)
MEKSDHVFLIGPDADRFAKENGLSMVENSYFVTDRAMKAFGRSHEKMGTVGAVAMDLNGDLAAGTSTGGTISSLPGRVGDSPVIGAGCYANNAICAVSCTGHGEYFLRNVVAYDLAALINYKGWPVQKSVEYIIHEKLEPQGGKGGIISIDKNGQVAIAYSTTGMFRGYVNSSGAGMTGVFEEVQRF